MIKLMTLIYFFNIFIQIIGVEPLKDFVCKECRITVQLILISMQVYKNIFWIFWID